MDSQSLIDSQTIWVLVVGALVIGAFAANQYRHWTGEEADQPDNPPRHYTTMGRYYLFGLFYMAAFILVYTLLILAPKPLVDMLREEVQTNDLMTKLLGSVINPRFIFAVLLITTASTRIPVVVTWEKKLRMGLHNLAKTPSHVQGAIKGLMDDYRGKFQPDDAGMRKALVGDVELKQYFLGQYFPPGDNKQDEEDSVLPLWAEINYLRWVTRQMPNYSTCKDKCCNQHELFKANYDKLTSDVKLYYDCRSKYQKGDTLLKRFERDVAERAKDVLKSLLTAICCGVFAFYPSKTDRAKALKDMGLDSSIVGLDPINWPTILWSFLLIFITAFAPTIVYFLMDLKPETAEEAQLVPANWIMAFLWSIGAFMLHGAAVITAIICSRNMSPGSKLPESITSSMLKLRKIKAAFWAAILTIIACLWILVSIAYPEMQKLHAGMGAADIVATSLNKLWPWCLIPLTTAIFTVVHREDAMAGRIKTNLKRVIARLATQAVVTCLMGSMATMLYLNVKDPSATQIAFLIYASVVSLLIGGVLGWMMPKGYRESLESKAREQKAATDFRRQAPAKGA